MLLFYIIFENKKRQQNSKLIKSLFLNFLKKLIINIFLFVKINLFIRNWVGRHL